MRVSAQRCGGDTARNRPRAVRRSTSRSPMGRASRSTLPVLAVGTMAWWSLILALLQAVIVPGRAELGEALPDGGGLHAADPQTGDGLGAASQGIDCVEEELTLPPSVTGVDHLGYVLPPQEGAQHVKLVPLVLGDGKPPALRQDGQLLQPPLGVVRAVGSGVCQLRQMPQAPAHQPAAPFQVSGPALIRPQDGGQTLGHRGLFGNH